MSGPGELASPGDGASAGRRKALVVGIVGAMIVIATAGYGVAAAAARHGSEAAAGTSAVTSGSWAGGDRIVFRSTEPGDGYGHVASVPLDDPTAERSVSPKVCDRVDATASLLSCLRIERGVVPGFSASTWDAAGAELGAWPLPGIPSRTRISPSGELVATTSFVTGHSYATVGFSTATVISHVDGTSLGNLEEWTLLRGASGDGAGGGEVVGAEDRNFWGVTFVDDETFYATAGMTLSGTTWLVRGDIAARTMTTLAENVECPSLSPDGSRIAFKRATGGGAGAVHWTPAVYDLATGAIELLPETRGIDDQIEWLDPDTIVYGMPRPDARGDSDVWRIDLDGSSDGARSGGAGEPRLFIEHAWSPAVVSEGRVG